MTTINLLHISDLHFSIESNRKDILDIEDLIDLYHAAERWWTGRVAASQDFRAVEALASFVRDNSAILDAIIITGDIATVGNRDDLEEGRAFITGIPERNDFRNSSREPVLGRKSDLPVFLLPGNHDRYIPRNFKLLWSPGGTVFHEVFNEFWDDDVRSFELVKDNTLVGILGADFSLRDAAHSSAPNTLGCLAEGFVYPDVLEELENRTLELMSKAEAAKQDCKVVWAVHFPPLYQYPLTGWRHPIDKARSWFKEFHHEDKLVDAANRHNVELIMAGHTHQHQFYPEGSHGLKFACAGTATQFYPDNSDAGNYCHIITLAPGAKPIVDNYRFDRIVGDFITVDS